MEDSMYFLVGALRYKSRSEWPAFIVMRLNMLTSSSTNHPDLHTNCRNHEVES